MSLFERAKKARENKKGFTLVELIVVLVILAILAAIMVPQLVGYIDKAKEKQLTVAGRTVMIAGQAAADEAYAENKQITTDDVNEYLKNELPKSASWNIEFTNYKVTKVQYSDGTDSATYTFDTATGKSEWKKDDKKTATTDAAAGMKSETPEATKGTGQIGGTAVIEAAEE